VLLLVIVTSVSRVTACGCYFSFKCYCLSLLLQFQVLLLVIVTSVSSATACGCFYSFKGDCLWLLLQFQVLLLVIVTSVSSATACGCDYSFKGDCLLLLQQSYVINFYYFFLHFKARLLGVKYYHKSKWPLVIIFYNFYMLIFLQFQVTTW
jgi:hypothetical protein